jgi:succinate dehydrogenase/fumarate reductase iron-sulfur protein
MGTHVFRIARSAASGVSQPFSVTLEPRMTVLDALFLIQRKQDPSLSFRCSCRVGMCGTCGMSINHQPRLACQTRVASLKSDTVHVAPLPHLPVVKDLVVDLSPFFERWKRIRPALHPSKKDSKELAVVPPDSEFGRHNSAKWNCITCACCYAACGMADEKKGYLGPAQINKAMLRLMDPRDDTPEVTNERLRVLNDEDGVWRCHTQFNCVAACPKGINLTDSIMLLKRRLIAPKRFHDKRRFTSR